MDPHKDTTWILILLLYGSLCGCYMAHLYANEFTADPNMLISHWTCEQMCHGDSARQRAHFGEVPGKFWNIGQDNWFYKASTKLTPYRHRVATESLPENSW